MHPRDKSATLKRSRDFYDLYRKRFFRRFPVMTHLEIPKDFVVLRSRPRVNLWTFRGLGLGSRKHDRVVFSNMASWFRPSTLIGNTSSSCSLPEGVNIPFQGHVLWAELKNSSEVTSLHFLGTTEFPPSVFQLWEAKLFSTCLFFPWMAEELWKSPKKLTHKNPNVEKEHMIMKPFLAIPPKNDTRFLMVSCLQEDDHISSPADSHLT